MNSSRRFARGLFAHEIAFVKSRAAYGLSTNYVFSFLLYPGRELTRACISEIRQGKIGSEVDPMTDEEANSFMQTKIAEIGTSPDIVTYGPLSSYHIGQQLGWVLRAGGDLLRDETQEIEFKIDIESSREKLFAYAKTMAAFANNKGGHIIFGVNDAREPVGIESDKFLNFDWDRLSLICAENFQPNVIWDRVIFEFSGCNLGAIYSHPSDQIPIIAMRDSGKSIKKGNVYFRYRGFTKPIEPLDLFELLRRRDEIQSRNGKSGK